MDDRHRMGMLISENKLLMLQLADLESVVRNAVSEEGLPVSQRTAYLQSTIDNNLAELAQLKTDIDLAAQKTAGIEKLNEDLEISLYNERKQRQENLATLKTFGSVKTELEIITNELDDAAFMHSRIQELSSELTELRSSLSLAEAELSVLKQERAELTEMVVRLRKEKSY